MNTVTASAKAARGDDPANKTATVTVTTEEAAASIDVTKTSENENVKVGQPVTYTITVKNTGNVTVSELALTDILSGIELGNLNTNSLAPGETAKATATYNATQADADAGKIDNKVTATGKDPNGNEVTDYAECTVTTEKGTPALTVTPTRSQ